MGEQIKESVVTRKVLGICVGEKRKQKGKYRSVTRKGRYEGKGLGGKQRRRSVNVKALEKYCKKYYRNKIIKRKE